MAQIWVVSDVRNKLCLALIWKRFWTAYPGQFSELLDNPWRLDFIRFDLIWFCLGKFWYRKHIEKCYGDERPSWARKPVEVNPGEDKEVGFTFYRVLCCFVFDLHTFHSKWVCPDLQGYPKFKPSLHQNWESYRPCHCNLIHS